MQQLISDVPTRGWLAYGLAGGDSSYASDELHNSHLNGCLAGESVKREETPHLVTRGCKTFWGSLTRCSLRVFCTSARGGPQTRFAPSSERLERDEGVTRLGATGLRASERANLPLRGSLRGPLKTSKHKTMKTSENL